MSFWAKFFGKKKKKEKSKYLPENEIPNDLSFVKKFTDLILNPDTLQ